MRASLKNKKLAFLVLLGALLTIAGGYLILYTPSDGGDQARHPVDSTALLVRIGSKQITVDEFIRRAEYTIRPRYCDGSTGVEKQIVLNSLIAEKLLALEAGPENELWKSEHYQRYIQGRKEQAMRQVLCEEEGRNKAIIDSAVVQEMYRLAGRRYEVEFFTVFSPARASELSSRLTNGEISFEQAFRAAGGRDSIPLRIVQWEDAALPALRQAMFSRGLRQDEVLAPVEINDSTTLFMKVKRWTTSVAVRDQDVRQRWNDVIDEYLAEQGAARYRAFASEVMRGKHMEFDRDAFVALGKLLTPLYFSSADEKGDAFLSHSLGKTPESAAALRELGSKFETLQNKPLLQVDGEVWTIGHFQQEYERHPLIFRKKRFTRREFPEQLKLAIADLVRDRYLTMAAYQRGYDSLPAVRQYVGMWADADAALYYKRKILGRTAANEDEALRVMARLVDSLQERYSDQVEIDVAAFNALQLTRVSTFVIQRDVPFPVYVPSFPVLTTDRTLDYGRKLGSSTLMTSHDIH